MTLKKWCCLLLAVLMLAGTGGVLSAAAETDAEATPRPFPYEHDPRLNPKAMQDCVYNPDAVYFFSPNPESVRLKDYVDVIDWTNPEQVAQLRAERQAYHDSLRELYVMIMTMLEQGYRVEAIARAVSTRRNELRLEAYDDDPDGLAMVRQGNLETYGNADGPTPEYLFEKYGSWQKVLEKALGTNAGADACLGFYDECYELYEVTEEVTETTEEPAATEEPAPTEEPEQPAEAAGG